MATDEIEAIMQKDREPQTLRRRRLPIGAEVFPGSGVHCRVWSTRAQRVEIVLEGEAASGLATPITVTLTPVGHGYFSGLVPTLGNGVLYHYRIDPVHGGYGFDALWNDDFHHSARGALTGCREAYYTDYRGTAQELISVLKWGYLYQGQYYGWQRKRRGTPTFGLKIPPIPRPSPVVNSTYPSANSMADCTRCTATSCACEVRIPY